MNIEKTEKYMIITATEGMVMTEWKEGDDILDFSYAVKQISPLTYDVSVIREITQEECDKLIEEQNEIIRLMEGK